ncbi:MAG: aminotransferase class I/II-fold pyridoxal phosphate-dependent enzyme [Terriglobia bacterium]
MNKCRSFIFDTALAPPAAGAALKALQIIAAEPFRQQRLIENQALLSRELEARGLGQAKPSTPIFPVILGEGLTTMKVCENLLIRGFYAQGIRPPAVPEGGARLRITVSAAHHQNEIGKLGSALEGVLRELGMMKTTGTTNE